MKRYFAIAAIAAAALGVVGVSQANASTKGPTITGSTAITNRPDGGAHGNDWANDNFTRNAQVTNQGAVPASNCGGNSPCYFWTGTIFDINGHFTTIAGQVVPGFGSLNNGDPAPTFGVSVTGPMSGTYHYAFYSDQQTTSATPPQSENDNSTDPTGCTPGDCTTGLWPELFFNSGNFYVNGVANPDSLGSNQGHWNYKLGFGKDPQCQNIASQWVDASFNNWGSDPVDGNILAPDSSHC